MRRFVDGVELELPSHAGAMVYRLEDRLLVRSERGTYSALAVRQGDTTLVSYLGRTFRIERRAPRSRAAASAHSGELHAPMPGAIADVLVEVGAHVERGDKLVVLEAMKTQQAFVAPFDGKVTQVAVHKGDQVREGALLAIVAPLPDS